MCRGQPELFLTRCGTPAEDPSIPDILCRRGAKPWSNRGYASSVCSQITAIKSEFTAGRESRSWTELQFEYAGGDVAAFGTSTVRVERSIKVPDAGAIGVRDAQKISVKGAWQARFSDGIAKGIFRNALARGATATGCCR